jgi:tetratricopeptide (TPR) repeat protein
MPRRGQKQQWSPVRISKWVAENRTNPHALYWINEAISQSQRGNKSCLDIMKQIRAQIYHSQGNIDQALEDIGNALELGGSPDTKAISNRTKAQILLSKGDLVEANSCINNALELGGSPDTQAIINQTKAKIDREMGVSSPPPPENVPLPIWCDRVALGVDGDLDHLVWGYTSSDSSEELGRGL